MKNHQIATVASFKSAFFDAFETGMLEHTTEAVKFSARVHEYAEYCRDFCGIDVKNAAVPAPRTIKTWFAEYTARRAD